MNQDRGENFFRRLPSELNYNIQTNSDKKWKEDFILHFKCFCDRGTPGRPSIIITFFQKHITRSQEPLISEEDKVKAPDREGEYREAIITNVNNDGTYNINFDNKTTRNNVRLEEIHLLESRVEKETTPEGRGINSYSTQEQHFINWVTIPNGPMRDKTFGNFFYFNSLGIQRPMFFERTFTGHHLNIDGRVRRHIIVRNRYIFYYRQTPNQMVPHSILWSPVFHRCSGGWKTTYPIVDYPREGEARYFFNGVVEGFLNTTSTVKQIEEKQKEWKEKYKLVAHHNNNVVPEKVIESYRNMVVAKSNEPAKNIVYDRTVNVIEAFITVYNRNWFINPFRLSNFLGWSFDCSYTKKNLYYLIPKQGPERVRMYPVPYVEYLKQYYKDAGIPIDTDQGHNIHKIQITPFTPFNIRYHEVGDVWFEPRMSTNGAYPIEEIFNNFIDRIEGTDTNDRMRVNETGVRPKYKWRMKDERGDWNNYNFNGQLRRAFVQTNHFQRKWNFGKMPTWNDFQEKFEANVDNRRECRAFFEIHLRCTTKEEETKMALSKQNYSDPSTDQEKNKINLKF